MEEMRYLSTPSTWSSSRIRSINIASFFGLVPSITSVPFPKSPKFTPVNTISFTPEAPIFFAFTKAFSIVSDLLAPLACGIVQKVHL